MQPLKQITSRYAVLAIDNIDTDQIIPARFLKGTSRAGLGSNAFYDWRYTRDGTPNPKFVLNQPAYRNVQVFVAGDNFGCGSSREHAPWALVEFGLRAVVSTSIADIFRNNALKNGFVPVQVDAAFHQKMLRTPGAEVTIDLETCTIALADGSSTQFPLEPFARYRLLNGIDELDFLLQKSEAIAVYEKEHDVL